MVNLKRALRDPAAWRQAITISTPRGVRPFADAMDDWQRTDFEATDNGWRVALGLPVAERAADVPAGLLGQAPRSQ